MVSSRLVMCGSVIDEVTVTINFYGQLYPRANKTEPFAIPAASRAVLWAPNKNKNPLNSWLPYQVLKG